MFVLLVLVLCYSSVPSHANSDTCEYSAGLASLLSVFTTDLTSHEINHRLNPGLP